MWANPAARNPQPSQRVIAIRDALAEEIVFDAPEQGLFEVLAEMADRAAIPIVLDFYTLLDARIPYDRPVGFNVSGASLGAVLDLMLDPQGLEAVIYQDALLVTTKRRANELMYVRMYDVRGLLVPPSEGVAAPLTQRTFDSVLDNTVRPESWFSAGGDARRELYVSDGATEVLLFVRQTEAGHADLKERLQQLEQWQSGQ